MLQRVSCSKSEHAAAAQWGVSVLLALTAAAAACARPTLGVHTEVSSPVASLPHCHLGFPKATGLFTLASFLPTLMCVFRGGGSLASV